MNFSFLISQLFLSLNLLCISHLTLLGGRASSYYKIFLLKQLSQDCFGFLFSMLCRRKNYKEVQEVLKKRIVPCHNTHRVYLTKHLCTIISQLKINIQSNLIPTESFFNIAYCLIYLALINLKKYRS